MPTPDQLASLDVDFSGGYFPSAQNLSPEELQRTIKAGSNVLLRAKGKLKVANGLLELSSTNVGARIFPADIQRAVIAGGLVGDRLPYAGFLRYENAVLLFLSENTSAQVYLDEVAVSGLTTSSTAGRLRVAVPDGVGGYNVFDAGFDKPDLPSASVTVVNSPGLKNMTGQIGVALAPWRSTTNAWGPPSNTHLRTCTPATLDILRIVLPTAVSGQDGWIFCGTRWNDQSAELQIVRYVRIQPRGTFRLENGSSNITAGVGTRFTQDLARGDQFITDGIANDVTTVTSDTTATILTPWAGATGDGKIMTLTSAAGDWFNSELLGVISRDTQRLPRAAGILQYAGRVFGWGIADPDSTGLSTAATGNVLAVMRDDNPEHVSLLRIRTASGSDLVNVLGGDGPLYLMTTTSLEVASFGGKQDAPYTVRVVAEPGFQASTNGCLYKDYFYGYSNKPLRTRAEDNIDVEFGEPVWEDMADWNGERVVVTVDPDNAAVLYVHDNGSTSEVIPWMTQFEQWGPPLNFSARIIDAAVVNGTLYVTYLDGGNYRVNQWEGGAGIGGTRYAASQYYDPQMLQSSRIKSLIPVGKLGSVSVYTATPDAAVPDVSDLAQAAATFPLSDTANKREPAIKTNIRGDAHAFRVDFASDDGTFDKLIVRGRQVGEDK